MKRTLFRDTHISRWKFWMLKRISPYVPFLQSLPHLPLLYTTDVLPTSALDLLCIVLYPLPSLASQ